MRKRNWIEKYKTDLHKADHNTAVGGGKPQCNNFSHPYGTLCRNQWKWPAPGSPITTISKRSWASECLYCNGSSSFLSAAEVIATGASGPNHQPSHLYTNSFVISRVSGDLIYWWQHQNHNNNNYVLELIRWINHSRRNLAKTKIFLWTKIIIIIIISIIIIVSRHS